MSFELHNKVLISNRESPYYGCEGRITWFHANNTINVVLFNSGDEVSFEECELMYKQEYVLPPQQPDPYHKAKIPRGIYGEVSKIIEEFEEFKDSTAQKSPVLELCELSDLIGAIAGYTEKKYNITLEQLVLMTQANKRAFESGHRVSC
jgi:hypothetical protein